MTMTSTLAHRGPDDDGVWVDGNSGIGLGFRRLAILDLSPAGHQPMRSGDGRYWIVFNGEIYNYRQLRDDLDGVKFRGTSDTEVILETVSAIGADATISRLLGMFAFALWDAERRELILARDRVGKKPLYYSLSNDLLLFGSELKALRAHPSCPTAINQSAVLAYLRHGYVPTPHSIYDGVRKLEPGCYAVIRDDGNISIHRYWDAEEVGMLGVACRVNASGWEACEQLDHLLRDAVSRRLASDVPIGALLSGGIDSSTVAALMQAQSGRRIKTFTIGFTEPGYDEAASARAIAEHLGTEHTELYVTPSEAQAVIPTLPDIYDEPFADSSQIPTFLLSKLARQHITVALSGDGGDESFGGYTRYIWARRVWRAMRFMPAPLRRSIAAGLKALPPSRWNEIYEIVRPAIPSSWRQRHPADKTRKLAELLESENRDGLYLQLVSHWRTPATVTLNGKEPITRLLSKHLLNLVPNFTERMMFYDLVTYLPDDILVKVDRASMAVGLEVRSPLLDHRVIQWAWRIPLSLKARGDEGKWILRQVLNKYVPRGLTDRPKMGFGVPIGEWLRGPLRDWAESLLAERALADTGILDPKHIRDSWKTHLDNRGNEEASIWIILMLQSWLSRWRPSH
jgi:asparagine synthase (glutamine-hydrolysing)